jgi:hypothetical protein
MTLELTIATVIVGAFAVSALWIRSANRRGRETLLRALRALPPDQRDQLLSKFTAEVQAQLRHQLQQNTNA